MTSARPSRFVTSPRRRAFRFPSLYYDDRLAALLSEVVCRPSRAAELIPPGYGRRRVDVDWRRFERAAVHLAGQPRLLSIIPTHYEDITDADLVARRPPAVRPK